MSTERLAERAAWALLAFVLIGEVLFGATGVRLWSSADLPLIRTRSLFFAIGAVLAAAGLLLLPRERRPGRGWSIIVLLFPAWLALQLVPLPVPLVERIDPGKAELLEATWPGPIDGCEGDTLVAADPPATTTLTVDAGASLPFLAHVVAALLAFLAARAVFARSRTNRRQLLLVVSLFTAVEAVYGIVQWLAQTPQVLWLEKTAHVYAASGTLINRNHFALLMYLGLACTITLLADRLRPGHERSEKSSRETGIRVTIAVVMALQIAAVAASQSRAGFGAVAILALAGLPLLYRGNAVVKGLATAILLMIAVPAAIVVGPDLYARLSSVLVDWQAATGRGAVLRHSIEIVRDFPVFGSGGGTFQWVFAGYRGPGIHGRYVYAHNDYLQVLVEAGALGLLLALLPVVLYAKEVVPAFWKERAAGNAIWRPWPVWLALGILAGHELVDFGLQVPAHTLLVGLLAGGLSVRRDGGTGSRWSVVLPVAGVLLAAPAAMHDVADWPGLQGRLPWPDLPSAHHDKQREIVREWRKEPEDSSRLCEALSHQARAVELRPLSAWYSLSLARVSAILYVSRAGEWDDARNTLEDQTLRAIELARRVDPWNSHIRVGLVEIALSLGALDAAAEDVRSVLSRSGGRAERIVLLLRTAGLPEPMIFDLVEGSPDGVREVLSKLRADGDWDTAGALIPADVEPTAVLCRAASDVTQVLSQAHSAPTVPFLRACLDLSEIRDDRDVQDKLLVTLAGQLMRGGELDEAAALVDRIHRPGMRVAVQYRLAQLTQNWDEVVRLAHVRLEGYRSVDDPWKEAKLRAELGEAYLKLGKRLLALRQFERALQLDPDAPGVEQRIRRMKRGD